MPERIRVGVIGLGPNGRVHLTSYHEHPGATVVAVPAGHPYAPEDRHVIDCLLEGKEPLINALDGARSAAAVLVVKDAIRERRPVAIPQLG
jgi:predicted dehydrogenase